MKARLRKLLWCALGVAIVLCVAMEVIPRGVAPSRLERLPLNGFGFAGRDLPLDEAEKAIFRRTKVLKRLYQGGGYRFVLLAVDGGGDRHAIHDPLYCFRGAGWTVARETVLPLPGGHGKVLQLTKGQSRAEAMYWISDGQRRHASALSAWGQSIRSRLSLSPSASMPVLVLVQPATGTTVNWSDLVERCPELLTL